MSKTMVANSSSPELEARSAPKFRELRKEWERLRKKLFRLESVKAIETDSAEIFDLEDKIEKTKTKIDQLEQALAAFDIQFPAKTPENKLESQSALSSKLHREIVDFLTSLPSIHDNFTQRALIYSAGLDSQLQNQISFGLPASQFIELLVPSLSSYGMLEDGRNALEAVLESAKQYVGQNRQAYCDRLIQDLRVFSQVEESYREGLSKPFQQLETPDEDEEDFSLLDRILRIIFAESAQVHSLAELAQLLGDKQLRAIGLEGAEFRSKGSKVGFMISTFKEIAEIIGNYREVSSHRLKNEQLIQLMVKLRKLKNSPLLQQQRYTQRLQETVEGWLQLVEDEIGQRVQDEFREIPNPFIYGNPIRPEDAEVFVGRQDIVERVEKLVATAPKPTLFLYGRRRSGKTSTLLNLGRFIGSQVICVFLDMQDLRFRESSEAFCRNLSEEIATSLPQLQATWQQQNFTTGPFSALARFLDDVEAFVTDREIAILLTFDEYERLDTRHKDILDTLRTIIQHRQNITVLIAGSHRFEEIPDVSWSDYLINTQTVEISWLDQRSAYKLITNPVEGFEVNYPQEMPEKILELTHCQPYLLQAVACELVNHLNVHRKKQVTDADLEEVLKIVLIAAEGYFVNSWQDECTEAERNLLEQIILQGEGTLRFDPANKILRSLLRKEILERTDNMLRFSVPLFKRWIQEKQLML